MSNRRPKLKSGLTALLGAFIQAFGVYQIHAQSSLTEGGILGAGLLLRHWFQTSPAVSGLFMNGLCYLMGYRTMGKSFLFHSLIGSAGYSLGYGIFEQLPPLDPLIGQKPLLASVLGALFVGVGSGICVRAGGAITGDDALALHWVLVNLAISAAVLLVVNLLERRPRPHRRSSGKTESITTG